MRIGIFVAMAGSRACGPETYEHGLVRELTKLDAQNEYHVFCFNRGSAQSFDLQRDNVTFHVLKPGIRWLSVPFSLPFQLMRSGVDFFHATFIPPPFSPKPYVLTMHGSVTFMHPEFFHPRVRWRLNGLVHRGIKKAELTICVTRHVRDAVADHFKISPDRLPVIYHGVGENFRPMAADEVGPRLRELFKIEAPYALYVGKLMKGKNIVRLLEGFALFRNQTRSPARLVLAGRRYPATDAIDDTIERLKLRDAVEMLGQVSHHDLPALYNGASMLVFPSLWEGFGLPVIEAMACATPVITSNISCLPEVAGGAAELVDPLSAEAIGDAMARVESDSELRRTLRDKGLKRAKMFSWKQTAIQTLETYRKIAAM